MGFFQLQTTVRPPGNLGQDLEAQSPGDASSVPHSQASAYLAFLCSLSRDGIEPSIPIDYQDTLHTRLQASLVRAILQLGFPSWVTVKFRVKAS